MVLFLLIKILYRIKEWEVIVKIKWYVYLNDGYTIMIRKKKKKKIG
jgi:hypothetical protein